LTTQSSEKQRSNITRALNGETYVNLFMQSNTLTMDNAARISIFNWSCYSTTV